MVCPVMGEKNVASQASIVMSKESRTAAILINGEIIYFFLQSSYIIKYVITV